MLRTQVVRAARPLPSSSSALSTGNTMSRVRSQISRPTVRTMASQHPVVTIKSMDHIVLTVKDIDATTEFYTSMLGMTHEAFTSPKDPTVTRHSLKFGSQKINLHRAGAEFEPKAGRVQPGSGDICFLTDHSVDEVLLRLKQAKIKILEGGKVVDRTGARGHLRSLYFRDPDENLIEVSNYVD